MTTTNAAESIPCPECGNRGPHTGDEPLLYGRTFSCNKCGWQWEPGDGRSWEAEMRKDDGK